MNEDMTVWEVFGKAQCPVEIWGWDVETGCSFMMRRFEQKEVSLGDFRIDIYQKCDLVRKSDNKSDKCFAGFFVFRDNEHRCGTE